MGYRTTAVFSNDQADILLLDPNIGKKIYNAVLGFSVGNNSFGPLGNVIEQAHADVASLVMIGNNGSFGGETWAATSYFPKEESPILTLLKQAADDLGYKLVKKPTKD